LDKKLTSCSSKGCQDKGSGATGDPGDAGLILEIALEAMLVMGVFFDGSHSWLKMNLVMAKTIRKKRMIQIIDLLLINNSLFYIA
jgi:hypothetical protein